ncbi:COX15/CtaA family protein [Salinarimonas chemoclinalis]|uniref:COX15/CtaA family protein n=1 Tax=Salinarimonas chemoclinalis TaxID=3241599 RepID=UPI003558D673
MSTLAVETSRSTGEPAGAAASPRLAAAVRTWVWTLVLLVIAMVAVGGATRLTGSGLSITEWKPVTGAIPPLSQAAWLAEFEKYRQIDQYRLLNAGMSLAEFQVIYWWEWGHRQLGRLLGLVFFIPLVFFWLKGAVSTRLAAGLLFIGALGGLQATVGWIMVASGLEPGMTAVAPIKLTTHLTIATLILGLLAWVATGLSVRERAPVAPAVARGARILVALLVFQIALGGLVAGSRAGFTFNTWPLMDGGFAPSLATLFAVEPFVENFVDNVALVQLNHRLVAYALLAFAVWHALAAWRADPGGAAARRAVALAGLTTAQAALGVVTLLLVVPLWAGLAHQVLAMLILVMAVVHLRAARDAPAARA